MENIRAAGCVCRTPTQIASHGGIETYHSTLRVGESEPTWQYRSLGEGEGTIQRNDSKHSAYLDLSIRLQRPCCKHSRVLIGSLNRLRLLRTDLEGQLLTSSRHARDRLETILELSNGP